MYKEERYLGTDVRVYEQTSERIRLLQLSKLNKLSAIRDEEGKKPKAIINCSYFTSSYVLGRNQGDMFNNTHDQKGFYDLVFLKDGSYKVGQFASWDWCDANEVLAGFSVATILVQNGVDCELWSEAIVGKSKITSKNPQTAVVVKKDGKVVFIVSEGRNSNDTGLTGNQLRDFAKARYDVELLVQLDGGGSSELIVDGKIKNYLSDGKERSMLNGLALIETENTAQNGSNQTTEGNSDENMALNYIDISKYQSNVDYAKASKGLDGVILRVGYTGYGNSKSKQMDPLFEKHYKGFSEQGVPIGVYWYSCASSIKEAQEEARLTLEYIKGKKIELPIWFDTEDTHHQKPLSVQTLTDIVIAYCTVIENAGYYAGVYASSSWLGTELDMDELKGIDVWVAHYGVKKPAYAGDYGMWQYTREGKVDGIVGNVDKNYAYKDYKAIIQKAGLNGLHATNELKAEISLLKERANKLEIENLMLEDELSKANEKLSRIKELLV